MPRTSSKSKPQFYLGVSDVYMLFGLKDVEAFYNDIIIFQTSKNRRLHLLLDLERAVNKVGQPSHRPPSIRKIGRIWTVPNSGSVVFTNPNPELDVA